ncbi:MAG: DUF4099 domain-containing protein [Rikenellaceae bacterium]
MAQKPKDILLVKDEKTGEIGVVSGLKKDGSPNWEDAKKGNKNFILFDRGGDVLDNFFKNFLNQCDDPYRFGFYRIAVEGAENVIAALSDMLKEPENYRDILEPHKVDTSKYEEREEQKVEKPKQSEHPKKGYEPIDPERIDWESLQKSWGINREALEQSGDLKKMLNFGKSDLVAVSPKFGEEQFNLDARLSFRRLEDGNIRVVPHFVRSEPNLKQEFFGHTFSAEDRDNLLKTGNMGRVVPLKSPTSEQHIPSLVSIDRQTNDIVALPLSKVRVPNKIGTTPITEQEQAELKAGRAITDKEITLASGKKFTTTLQVNADQRGVEFLPRSVQPAREQRQGNTQRQSGYKWVDDSGNIRPPKTLGGVELTPDQQSQFKDGKAILVKDMMTDKKGEPYTAYVKFNHELGRPRYYRNDPDVARSITPTNESKQQVAPRNTQQQNQQKRKGVSI